jgi:alkanesulfonate monooxygenase SsuD/methylene tetrahydromethanopterin reductase-like flavin-dependent oxidoreductase (luciferase family)
MLPVRLTDDVSDSLINDCKYRIARILSEKFVGELFINLVNPTKYLSSLRQFVYEQNKAEIYKLITNDMVDQYYVIGDQNHCAKRINEYIEAGVGQPLLLPRLVDFMKVAEKLNPEIVMACDN